MWKREGIGGLDAVASAATYSATSNGADEPLWDHAMSTKTTTASTTAG
jgi:hypothetical protein